MTVDYNSMSNDAPQIRPTRSSAPDAPRQPAEPHHGHLLPGRTAGTVTNPALSTDATASPTCSPGVYTTPVELTGTSALFQDCPGATRASTVSITACGSTRGAGRHGDGDQRRARHRDPVPHGRQRPGLGRQRCFRATGAGNGAPCLSVGTMTSAASGNGSPEPETSSQACGGTSPTTYGVLAYRRLAIAARHLDDGDGQQLLPHGRRRARALR